MKKANAQIKAVHLTPVPDTAEDTETLFQRHHEQVFRTAYRVLGSAVDAEDVLQTVFLRLLRRGRTDLSPSPGSYLQRAAVNASLDLLRARRRVNLVPLDDLKDDLVGNASLGPDKQLDGKDLRMLLQRSIGKLGDRAAETFVLRYLEGYDNSEIAEMIGTSKLVVAVTLYRARAKVCKDLGKFLEVKDEAR